MVLRAKKVFHTLSLSMCKTVEKSVDYAENLYFAAFFRHFSPFYAKKLWKTFEGLPVSLSFFFISFYNFYKSIDFSRKIGYNGVTKRIKRTSKPQKGDLPVNENELKALLAEAVHDADLHPAEIPSIDLYLDQITSLADEKRKEGSPRFADRALTKTMINNYSKDGLLSPIKGKKYTKEQILQMLLVYEMKNTLSIGEIKRVLQNLYALPEYDAKALESIYTRYLAAKEDERATVVEEVASFADRENLNLANEEDFLVFLLSLSAMSSYLKNAVQILLESHYPDLNEERSREEQEKKEAAKRQKAEQKAEKKASKSKKEGVGG